MMKCQHCGGDNADDARFCGVCGRATSTTEPSTHAPPTAPSPDISGREIGGRFRILAKLGEGGMGAVYRGEQISLKRKVAIKLLRPELSRDPAIVRRFNAEAEAVAKLSHPSTVSIFDFGQDADGTLFIAMEYLEGRSLRQALTDGPIAVPRALHIATQIAASLTDAHRHGIVHRDLKPDNVMLIERGKDRDVVRVLDFGIAKLRDEQNKMTVNPMTQQGDLVGTPQYMAPEQIRGETVDGRTDVYALGAIIYEMVTGRMLVEGATVMQILSRHLLEMPQPPTRRRPDLAMPPAIDPLVMEMLAKDPKQRLASMEIATDRIGGLAAQLGGYTVPTPPRAMSRPPGVPQTMPPGMMMAPPPGIAPPVVMTPPPPPPPQQHVPTAMHGMHPHAYQGMPPTQPQAHPGMPPTHPHSYPAPAHAMTPPHMHLPMAYAQPAQAGSKLWLWILLGVLLAGGVVAGVLVASRGVDKAAQQQPPVAGDVVDLGGWKLTLPVGFLEVQGVVEIGKTYAGTIAGNNVAIIAIAVPEDSSGESLDQLDDGCTQIVAALFEASMTDSGIYQGRAPLHYHCDFMGGQQRGEGRMYSVPGSTLALFFATDTSAYDATTAARVELFERRVAKPASGS